MICLKDSKLLISLQTEQFGLFTKFSLSPTFSKEALKYKTQDLESTNFGQYYQCKSLPIPSLSVSHEETLIHFHIHRGGAGGQWNIMAERLVTYF